jgi:site-specific DNA recombinase
MQVFKKIFRVFRYIRVSTLTQYDTGSSLQTQEAQIKSYCATHNLNLQYIYRDEGISGKDIDGRPALKTLLSNLHSGDIYIFTSISRLGRSTAHNIAIMQQLQDNECKLVILDMDIDTTTLMGNAMFQMTSVISEVERKLISQRTKDVMQYMKQAGTLRTKPPFGYKIEVTSENKRIMIKNEKEQKVIQFIRDAVQIWPTITISNIMKLLKLEKMTLRNGKLYHEGIRSILKRENIK